MAASLQLVSAQPEMAAEQTAIYRIGPWVLDAHGNRLSQDNICVDLEQRLCSLLVYLLQRPQQILCKDELLNAIWRRKVVNEDSLAVAISQLRKILDDNPRSPTYIKTIPGIGYQYIWQPRDLLASVVSHASRSVPQERKTRPWALTVMAVALIAAVAVSGYLLGAHSQRVPTSLSPVENNAPYERAAALLASHKQDDMRQAVPLFRQAIKLDPANDLAYLGLAEAKVELLGDALVSDTDTYKELRGLLFRALELNPRLARAHMWLGVLFMRHDRNFRAAEDHFKASLDLNPNDDRCHFLYEQLLLVEKRFAEAREQIALARAINPLTYPYTYLVWVYMLEHNYALAAHELDRIAATEMEDSYFHTAAQNVYYLMGNEQKAYEHMQWFFNRRDYSPAKKAELEGEFHKGGLNAVYTWLLAHKEETDVGQYTPPLSWARYAVALGKKDEAMDYLEQAYEKRQFRMLCAVTDPRYDPLRQEPRFQQLLQKLTLPK
jgi:DNA-binding winged helix-turn-helix (wHTH) protein/Tfp pilus assembly protein PilF